jgi:hypothetical protein
MLAMPLSSWAQTADDREDDPRNPKNFHSCTLGGGAGYSAVVGKDGSNLSGEWDVQASAGFAVVAPTLTRHWNLFLDFDYLYDQASVKQSALAAARNLNPTDIGLLNATGGSGRFNVVAFDPTVRFQISRHAEFYVFGGFGWLRRQVDLTGVNGEGALLQPGLPAVFLRDANSGSLDGGAGINFKKKGRLMPYVEVRVVHGMAVNGSSTLIPFAVGLRW